MNACRRGFDKTKYMSFSIKDNKLLKKYNEILKKGSNSIKKEFNSEAFYNEKYLKTKIKSYNGKINICIYLHLHLLVILIDSVYRKDKNYYPQVCLECC